MSKLIEVHFMLCDHLNPGFGYQVEISNGVTGEQILFTSKDPVTGKDLLTAHDCLDVITPFAEPKNEYYDALKIVLEAAGIRKDQWAQTAEAGTPENVIDELHESGHDECQEMAGIIEAAIETVNRGPHA